MKPKYLAENEVAEKLGWRIIVTHDPKANHHYRGKDFGNIGALIERLDEAWELAVSLQVALNKAVSPEANSPCDADGVAASRNTKELKSGRAGSGE